jgi:hypothetical protein
MLSFKIIKYTLFSLDAIVLISRSSQGHPNVKFSKLIKMARSHLTTSKKENVTLFAA